MKFRDLKFFFLSTPQFFKFLSSRGSNKFWSTNFSEISDLVLHLFLHHHLQVQAAQCWFSQEFPLYLLLHGVGILSKDAEGYAGGLAKTSPDVNCVSQILGGIISQPRNPPRSSWRGNSADSMGTCESCPLCIDSASLKSFESI